jgi:hypothetical protein
VARELGCSEYSLNLWKKAYLRQQAPASFARQSTETGNRSAPQCPVSPTTEVVGGRFQDGTAAIEILFLNMLSAAIVGQTRNSL